MSEFSAQVDRLIALQRSAQRRDGVPSEGIRIDRLNRVALLIKENHSQIEQVISDDYSYRSADQTLIELWSSILCLNFNVQHVGEWMRSETREGLAPSTRAIVEYTPKGVVGIVGPWNVPWYLLITPLAGVLAAGNRAIIKPPNMVHNSAVLVKELFAKYFSDEEIAVVLGGAAEGAEFTAADLDHIMFTGSTGVGKLVMKAAADHLVPVTLELGGKCPTILTESFDVEEAAARLIAIKGYNGGQICVAPDHAYVPVEKKDAFVNALLASVAREFPTGLDSPDYTSMVNEHHHQRMQDLVQDARDKGATIIQASEWAGPRADRKFPITLVLDPTADMQVMKEEIFGPILPVFTYTDITSVLDDIATRDHPLSLFVFSRDEEQIRFILDHTTSGGVTVNDVMANIYPDDIPFGGIGASGMGHYHGREGFRQFSHARSVYYQTDDPELAPLVNFMRAPYTDDARAFFLAEFKV